MASSIPIKLLNRLQRYLYEERKILKKERNETNKKLIKINIQTRINKVNTLIKQSNEL